MKSNEIGEIIEGFRHHLTTEEAKSHLSWLREKEPKEVQEVLEKLKAFPKDSTEFVDLVLYGLLPYGNTKYAKRVSIAPAFLNIRKFFARFNYTEEDWKELSCLIYELVVKFQKSPHNLEEAIRDFVPSRLSKGLQCGSLSPVFYALNSNFPMINNRVIRTYQRLYSLVFGEIDKLNQRLENYLSNVDKVKKLAQVLSEKYGFKEITEMALFDYLCYWYDSKVMKKEGSDENGSREELGEAKLKEIYLPSFVETVDLENPSKFSPHLLRNPERIKITQIISQCSSTSWVLPHFQRYFDWKTQDVSDFLKSIFNDYYVGAFLLWDAGRDPEVKVQAIKGVGKSKDFKSDSVILDGQQRITSLFYAINAPNLEGFSDKSNWRDTRIYREHPLYFYINFGTFLRDPKSPDVIEIHKMRIGREDCFKSILFPLYELEKYDEWVSKFEKFLRDYSDNHDKIYDIKEIIRKKLSHMWAGYEIPYILLPKEMKIDQVTEIFEQLNTKGKPLSVFDLLIARLYKYDIKLKDLWDSTTRKYPNIFRYSKYIEKTPIYILQAISLFYDKNSSAKRSDILDIHKNIYEKTEYRFEDHWSEFSEYLNIALKKLENLRDGFGVKDEKSVPFAPMIPVLTALLRLIETHDNKADCYKKLDKWYWSSVFTNSYSQAADTRMTKDFKEIGKWFEDDSKIPAAVSDIEDALPRLRLMEIQSKSNSKYRGVMSLIALEGAKDFNTNLAFENARDKNDKDHLFPKSDFRSFKRVNSVLNMTWNSKDTNRYMKRCKRPSVYVQEFVSKRYGGDKEKFSEILRTHLISKKAFNYLLNDEIELFLGEREKAIISKLEEHLEIEDIMPKPTLITPETPYTNKKIFWDTLRLCEEYIHWVDKYFSKAGLELLSESSLDSSKVREIKILTSLKKADESFRKLFKNLGDELENKGIHLELRVVIDPKTKSAFHDRWIISKNKCFNVTSTDVAARGQYSEIRETSNRPPFVEWWNNSKDIIKDWNGIKKHFNKQLSFKQNF